MKKPAIMFILLSGVVGLLVGCGEVLTTSGIPDKLDTDALILAAGKPQGVRLSGNGERGRSHHERSLETERLFQASLSSGAKGQFLAAYRAQVKRAIEGAGATVADSVLGGTEDDVVDFSYDYAWRRNAGIVRVYSFEGTNGQLQVLSFCYEHRK